MKNSRLVAIVAATAVGAFGGFGCMGSCHLSLLAGPGAGGAYGALFGCLFARRCTNPGAGIIGGSATPSCSGWQFQPEFCRS